MRNIFYVLAVGLFALLIFQGFLLFSTEQTSERYQSYLEQAPIVVNYSNHTLYIYNPHNYLIEKIQNTTVNSSNTTISIPWDSCPLALRIYTNKGLYKTYYIECT